MTFVVTPSVDQRVRPDRFEKTLDGNLPDCVIGTVLSLTELGAPSLNLQVGTGRCFIKGYDVQISAAETLAMTASQTAKVYVQLVRNGNSQVTGAQLGKTTGALPSDSMQIAEVVTDGTNITTITSKQRLRESDAVIYLPETTAPASPEVTTDAKLYVKNIDGNNQGIFAKIKINGSIQEVRIV